MSKKISGESPRRGARLEVVRGGTDERVAMRSREREADHFVQKMGEVHQVSRDTTRGVSGDAPQWAKIVSQPGYKPNVFQFPGWQEWSAENTARNFAIIHDVARQAGLDRSTAGALTASMFFTSEMRGSMFAGGTVKKMEVLPHPEEGTFALSFDYDHQGDVRQPKTSAKAEKVGLEYEADELDEYRMPGLEGDTVNKQALAGSLKEEKGSLAYDEQTESFLVYHHIEKDGSFGFVPGEMIGAEEYLTPAEHRLVQGAGKHRKEWVDFFTNDKVKGWETTEFSGLGGVRAKRRGLEDIRDNAQEFADEESAERLAAVAQDTVDTLVEAFRRRWAEKSFKDAKANLKHAIEQEPFSFRRLLSGKKDSDPEQYYEQIKLEVEQLAEHLSLRVEVDTRWLRRLESLDKGKGRIEAQLQIRLSLPRAFVGISDPRPGKQDKKLHLGDNLIDVSDYSKIITAPIDTRTKPIGPGAEQE